jgi:DNA adenine methylase
MIPSEFNKYHEPFVGGGAMFFHLMSDRNMRFSAYLSDINEELITAYKVVKDEIKELIQILRKYEREYRINPSEFYYRLRDEIKPSNEVETAARFITLNKTCYNGLYRVNRNAIFNVPMGRYKNPLICDTSNLENISNVFRFSKAVIKIGDYKDVLHRAKKDDFIYLDPAYHPISSTSSFTGYTDYGFDDDDQSELAKIFVELDHKKFKVLLSNSDTRFIRTLYSDSSIHIREVNVLRAINCKASKRIGQRCLQNRSFTGKRISESS